MQNWADSTLNFSHFSMNHAHPLLLLLCFFYLPSFYSLPKRGAFCRWFHCLSSRLRRSPRPLVFHLISFFINIVFVRFHILIEISQRAPRSKPGLQQTTGQIGLHRNTHNSWRKIRWLQSFLGVVTVKNIQQQQLFLCVSRNFQVADIKVVSGCTDILI